MKELLNSPLWILGVLVLLPLSFSFLKKINGRKCEYCKTGKLRKVSEKPEGVNHYSQPNSQSQAGSHFTVVVRMTVKYQCSNCKEFLEVQENR